jgi:hypothetical protein
VVESKEENGGMAKIHDDWKWYSGNNEEYFSLGPFDTRQEAIDAAQDDAGGEFQDDDGSTWKVGVHIVEARKESLRLSQWIDVERMVENADEDVGESDRSSEYDVPPYFKFTKEQYADLVRRLKAACDEWQSAYGLTFNTHTFSAMRNADYVVVPHPYNEEAS